MNATPKGPDNYYYPFELARHSMRMALQQNSQLATPRKPGKQPPPIKPPEPDRPPYEPPTPGDPPVQPPDPNDPPIQPPGPNKPPLDPPDKTPPVYARCVAALRRPVISSSIRR